MASQGMFQSAFHGTGIVMRRYDLKAIEGDEDHILATEEFYPEIVIEMAFPALRTVCSLSQLPGTLSTFGRDLWTPAAKGRPARRVLVF
jgi:hypothetical protein